jgi:hypothetical protein
MEGSLVGGGRMGLVGFRQALALFSPREKSKIGKSKIGVS